MIENQADASTSPGDGPVVRAFRVLQTVVGAGGALGVREIGRRCDLPRSTVSRLIATLQQLGMVERTPDGSVLPGSALSTLQPGNMAPLLLQNKLRPLLVELVERFGENAALAVDDVRSLLYLVQINTSNPVSAPDLSAERHSFHLVAPGILAMSAWSADRLDDYLNEPLRAATDHSVVDASAVRKRIQQVRRDGFVWTDQELDLGVNGFAVPIMVDGEMTATISLYGPSYRFSPETRPGIEAEVLALVAERAGG